MPEPRPVDQDSPAGSWEREIRRRSPRTWDDLQRMQGALLDIELAFRTQGFRLDGRGRKLAAATVDESLKRAAE